MKYFKHVSLEITVLVNEFLNYPNIFLKWNVVFKIIFKIKSSIICLSSYMNIFTNLKKGKTD